MGLWRSFDRDHDPDYDRDLKTVGVFDQSG